MLTFSQLSWSETNDLSSLCNICADLTYGASGVDSWAGESEMEEWEAEMDY